VKTICSLAIAISLSFCFYLSGLAQAPGGVGNGQTIRSDSGAIFMEEAAALKRLPEPAGFESPSAALQPFVPTGQYGRPPVDPSNVGVPVDASGRIVPLIRKDSSAVMPLFSELTTGYEPIWSLVPVPFAYAYGLPLPVYGPGWGPFAPGSPYLGWGGGWPWSGQQFPGYYSGFAGPNPGRAQRYFTNPGAYPGAASQPAAVPWWAW